MIILPFVIFSTLLGFGLGVLYSESVISCNRMKELMKQSIFREWKR